MEELLKNIYAQMDAFKTDAELQVSKNNTAKIICSISVF